MEPLVLRSDDGAITTLTLNRPAKLNALDPAMFIELRGHVDDLDGSDGTRVVLLRGAGRAFCAGHDLEAISAGERAPTKHYEAEVVDLLAALAIPTIAVVHGYCLTGGLELALACDLIVAAESARLGDTHSRWGLVPAWGMSVRLPERIGLARAKELMFTSRVLDAPTAAAIGLVDRCVPDADLDRTVDELGREIAATSKGTNSIVKQLLADRLSCDPAERLHRERTFHHGVPSDMRERLRSGRR